MKPALALPKPASSRAAALVNPRNLVIDRADLRNISLLLLGFAILLVLIPPVRSYPISDDWAYAQSVSRLLDFTYAPHEAAQPSALGHLLWGVLFSTLFGSSFTVLTLANVTVSALCLFTFYMLLRHLAVASTYALFGTALLGLNPMYLFLTYTFMTDVTFLAYLLGACLFFVRAMQGRGDGWLWGASAAAALAYLTRQHGIVLLPAMLAYLWWSRRLSVRAAIACAAIPLATLLLFVAWQSAQPPQIVSRAIADTMQSILANPTEYPTNQMQRIVWAITLPGLCLLPLLFIPRKPWILLPFFTVLIYFQFRSLTLYGSLFPQFGNIVDHTGLVLYDYNKPVLWSEQVWGALGLIGSSSFAVFSANLLLCAWNWLRKRPWRDRSLHTDPALFFYLAGLLLAVISILSPFLFDRYILPVLPMLLLFPLRRLSASPSPPAKTAAALPWVVLLPIALFSLLALRDYKAESAARWNFAETVASGGVKREQINAGYEWLGWYLFQEGVDYIRRTGDYKEAPFAAMAVSDPVYVVSEFPLDGYTQIDKTTYDAWLLGGQEREILLLKRK